MSPRDCFIGLRCEIERDISEHSTNGFHWEGCTLRGMYGMDVGGVVRMAKEMDKSCATKLVQNRT